MATRRKAANTLDALAAAVNAYCTENYENGWCDLVIETLSPKELAAIIEDTKTEKAAIAAVKAHFSEYAEVRSDIQAEADYNDYSTEKEVTMTDKTEAYEGGNEPIVEPTETESPEYEGDNYASEEEQTLVEPDDEHTETDSETDESGDAPAAPAPAPVAPVDPALIGDEAFDAAWLATWAVTVAPLDGTKAHKANVAPMVLNIVRLKSGDYIGREGSIVGKHGSTPKIAANNLLRIKKLVPGDFGVEGLDNEPAKPAARGDNEPTNAADPWVTNPAEANELNILAQGMAEQDDAITESEVSIRAGWRSLGSFAMRAKERIAGYSTTGNADLVQWGRWITSQQAVGGILFQRARLSKNSISEAIDFASAPEEVLAEMPLSLNSPKAFQKWRDGIVRDFAESVADVVFAAKASDIAKGNGAPTAEEIAAIKATNRELAGYVRNALKRYEKDVEEARALAVEASRVYHKDEDKPKRSLESFFGDMTRQEALALKVIPALANAFPAEDAADFDAAFVGTKLGRAVVKAWEAELAEQSSKAPVAPKDESESEGGNASNGAAKRAFAELGVSEAAAHIVTLLKGRADWEEVMDEALQALADAAEAKVKAEAAKEEGATAE